MTNPKQNTPSDNLRESLLMVLKSEIINVEKQSVFVEGAYVAKTEIDEDLKRYLDRLMALLTYIERFEM